MRPPGIHPDGSPADQVTLQETTPAGPSLPGDGNGLHPFAEASAPPPAADLPAQAGRYRIEGELARGGMGVVLRALDTDLGRDLAVKVLLTRHRGHPDLERRFLAEARLTGQLQHPGIPPVHELGRLDDGRPFFAMKLIQGRTLADLLAERPNPHADRTRYLLIFEQVCQAVAYAHSRGVVHRDLKPSNVMVGAFGEVQVMDWGLAKILGPTGERPPQEDLGEVSTLYAPQMGADGSATLAGSVLGTPAYMAPEQARGEVHRVDERADVFGLGASLCVILTGQPPYRGPETFRQARQANVEDARARLEACGADAEVLSLALACLAPEPADRPPHAGEVAVALAAYQAAVQARLQQAERERAAAEVKVAEERKRRRLLAGLAAALLGLVLGGAGSGLWLQRQQAERREETRRQEAELRQEVGQALRQAELFQGRARWAEAREVLGRAERRLGAARPEDLGERVGEATRWLELAAKLDAIRLNKMTLAGNERRRRQIDRSYAATFLEAGLAQVGEDPESVVARVRGAPIAAALVAALDDWASTTLEPRRRTWLLTVSRAADPDSQRNAFRDPGAWADRQALRRLVQNAPVDRMSPALVTALGQRLHGKDGASIPLLRRAQALHPADFWLNFELGNACGFSGRNAEAVGYYRAALVARPDAGAVHHNLGLVLKGLGQIDEAVAACQQAIALNPKSATAHDNLGLAWQSKGNAERAIAAHRKAIVLNPRDADAHNNLGAALRRQGRAEEALAEFRKAVALDPGHAIALSNMGTDLLHKGQPEKAIPLLSKAAELNPALAPLNLGVALERVGRLEEAVVCFRKARRLEPRRTEGPFNLGVALVRQGNWDEAIPAFKDVIKLEPGHAGAHFILGQALAERRRWREAVQALRHVTVLEPKRAEGHFLLGRALAAEGQLAEAVSALRKAVDLDPRLEDAWYNLGNTLRDASRPTEAVVAFRKAIALSPNHAQAHCNLGMVLRDQGQLREALASLRRGHELGVKRPRWRYPSARWVEEARRLVELEDRLAALVGDEAKGPPAEVLQLAHFCYRHKRSYAAAARLYASAFARDPKLADDPRNGRRDFAACAAALAAGGHGKDAAGLDAKARAGLRNQALEWLRGDLAGWARLIERDWAVAGLDAEHTLARWQKDTDFDAVRGSVALAKLPSAERKEWERFWSKVADMLRQARGKM